MFERAGAAMLLADDERRYIDSNLAAETLLRCPRELLLTLRIGDFTPVEAQPSLAASWESFLAGEAIEGDFELVLRDGDRIPVSISATASILPGVHLSVLTPRARAGVEREAELVLLRGALPLSLALEGDGSGAGRHVSPREGEVLTLLAMGATGAEVAEILFISPETVRTHVRNAMGKLGAKTRAHAITLAISRGLIRL